MQGRRTLGGRESEGGVQIVSAVLWCGIRAYG
jgi:hypothetical protein